MKLIVKGALPVLALPPSLTLSVGLTVIVSALAEALWAVASVTVKFTLYGPAAV